LRLPFSGVKRVSIQEQLDGEGGWVEVCRLEFEVGGFFDVPWGYWGRLREDLQQALASRDRLER
jgi:hypothetical protein